MDIFGRKKRKRIKELEDGVDNMFSIFCRSHGECARLTSELAAVRESRDYWGNAYWDLYWKVCGVGDAFKRALEPLPSKDEDD